MPLLPCCARRALPALFGLALALSATAAPAVIIFFTSGDSPTTLYAFDAPDTGAFELKTLESAPSVHSLAFCPDRERPDNLIGLGRSTGVIFEIQIAGFNEVVLGQLPAEMTGNVVQMTCDRDGTLYLGDQLTDELLSLDLATCPSACVPVVVGRLETSPGAADIDMEGGDLEVDSAGNLYLITNLEGQNVFQVDKATALATPIGTLETGGWITGGTWLSDDVPVAMADDDLVYWKDLGTDASGTLGPLTVGGQPLDLSYGDMARPIEYDPVLTVDVDQVAYAPGDTVTFDLFFRNYRFSPNVLTFTLWVADGDDNPISQFVTTGPAQIPYLKSASASRSFTLPLKVLPGTYRLYARVNNFPDGPFFDFAEFEVVAPLAADSPG